VLTPEGGRAGRDQDERRSKRAGERHADGSGTVMSNAYRDTKVNALVGASSVK